MNLVFNCAQQQSFLIILQTRAIITKIMSGRAYQHQTWRHALSGPDYSPMSSTKLSHERSNLYSPAISRSTRMNSSYTDMPSVKYHERTSEGRRNFVHFKDIPEFDSRTEGRNALQSLRRSTDASVFHQRSNREEASLNQYYLNDAQRRAELSEIREREARIREKQALEDSQNAQTSLIESRVAEELSREQSRRLTNELARAQEDLNSSRLEEEHYRADLNRSLTSLEARVRESEADARRVSESVAIKSDEIETIRRHLKQTLSDLRRRDEELSSKDSEILRLQHMLRIRGDEIADLKLERHNLQSTIGERDDHIITIERALQETEHKLNDRADELAELKLSLRDVKRRTEEQDRNLDFNQKRHQNEVQALKHECESAHEAVSARDKEISFMRGKLEDLERSLGEQRREMMLRDERLDKRHAEVQSWTSECDRLRLQLEQTRQRNIDTAKDHEARVNELKSSERELLSRISSIEVQRASSIFREPSRLNVPKQAFGSPIMWRRFLHDVAIAAKEDLIVQVSRLERQVGDLENQVNSLRRALDEREQLIAELGGRMGSSTSVSFCSQHKRSISASQPKQLLRRTRAQSKWRY
eukprot:gene604-3914_t